MSAEDLDKLFREKLQNRPVAPSSAAWERLQAQMQPPVQKEERKPMMWYYSAAAAVTLLISAGLWTMNQGDSGLQPSGSMATVQEKLTPANAPVQLPTQPQNSTVEKNTETEATVNFPAASTKQKEQMANMAPRTSTETKASSSHMQETIKPEKTEVKITTPAPEMLAVAPRKEKQVEAAHEAPLEIIVKLDNNQGYTLAQATPEVDEEPEAEKGTSRVLKGILKQVKNLKDGEKLSLSELGIAKHTYALETRIGNKTISKTIEL